MIARLEELRNQIQELLENFTVIELLSSEQLMNLVEKLDVLVNEKSGREIC